MRLTETVFGITVGIITAAIVLAESPHLPAQSPDSVTKNQKSQKSDDFEVPAVKYKIKKREGKVIPVPIPKHSSYGFEDDRSSLVKDMPQPGPSASVKPSPLPSASSGAIEVPEPSPSPAPQKEVFKKKSRPQQKKRQVKPSPVPVPITVEQEDLDEDEVLDDQSQNQESQNEGQRQKSKVGPYPEIGGLSPSEANPAFVIKRGLDQPSSVLYDPATELIFVSSQAGAADRKDNKGWISKFNINGQMLVEKWNDRLSAPAGMRIAKGKLWVTDLDRVVAITLSNGRIYQSITILGSKSLSDLVVHEDGRIFVADSQANVIWLIEGDRPREFIRSNLLKNPTAMDLRGNQLIITSKGNLGSNEGEVIEIDIRNRRQRNLLNQPMASLSGICDDGAGNYLVSDSAQGRIFRVMRNSGRMQTLLNSVEEPGDLSLITPSRILLLPSRKKNLVLAYSLKSLDEAIRKKSTFRRD